MAVSVIVDDFDIAGVAFAPPEADTPLVVDADAPLAIACAAELLQTVARRGSKVVERDRRIELPQPPQRDPLDIGSESLDRLPSEETLRVGVAETTDHSRIITHRVMVRNRTGSLS
jgi:hypothetical protein